VSAATTVSAIVALDGYLPPGTGAWTWTSGVPAVATIDGADARANAPGTTTLTATPVSGLRPPLRVTLQVTANHAPAVPPDGSSYFGLTVRDWEAKDPDYGDTRPYEARWGDHVANDLGGKLPTMFTITSPFQNDDGTARDFAAVKFWIDKYHAEVSPTGIPVVWWQAETGWSNSAAGITTATVASGAQDDYITRFAMDVASYGQPMFFRALCLEVNLNLNPNCAPTGDRATDKATFVAAFQHVTDLFRRAGATNVAWIVSMNTFPVPPESWGSDTDIAGYFPALDPVVPLWLGVDHYPYGNKTDPNGSPLVVAPWMDPFVQFAEQHGVPIFIPEFGIRFPGSPANAMSTTDMRDWLTRMFDYFEQHPVIKGFTYFDYSMINPPTTPGWFAPYDPSCANRVTMTYPTGQVNYCADVNDYDERLLTSPLYQTAFKTRIADARYSSSLF
jgi:hypothetical protein